MGTGGRTAAGTGGGTGPVTTASWGIADGTWRRRRAPVPPGAGSVKRRVPPWSWATQRATARPSPVPPPVSLVPKRWNTRSRSSGGTPGPWSATSSHQWSSVAPAVTCTGTAVRGVAPGVVEGVDQQLPQPCGVGGDDEVGRDRDVVRRRPSRVRHLADAVGDQPGQPDLAGLEPDDARLEPGQLQQVGHQVPQPLGLGQGTGEVLGVGRDDAVGEVLQDGGHGGQRGAQLVRDRGDEVAPLGVDLLEVGRHPVEGGGEPADLVGGGRADPPGVVAPRHPLGDVGHLPQRRHHPGGEQLGHPEGQRHRDRHGQQRGHPGGRAEGGEERGHDDRGGDEGTELDLDAGDRVERAVHGVTSPRSRA